MHEMMDMLGNAKDKQEQEIPTLPWDCMEQCGKDWRNDNIDDGRSNTLIGPNRNNKSNICDWDVICQAVISHAEAGRACRSV